MISSSSSAPSPPPSSSSKSRVLPGRVISPLLKDDDDVPAWLPYFGILNEFLMSAAGIYFLCKLAAICATDDGLVSWDGFRHATMATWM